MTDGSSSCRIDSSLIVADDGQKVAVANEFDRSLCGAANGPFIDRGNGCTPVGLTDNAGVNRSVELYVMNENAVAEHFSRQIKATATGADAFQIRDCLARGNPGCPACEVDRARQCPVVLPRRCAVAMKAAIANG
jgi:hypothetical protein